MSESLTYTPEDFKITHGVGLDKNDPIAYVFDSNDGEIYANFFYGPQGIEVRGMVGSEGNLHIKYLYFGKYSDFEIPKSEAILSSIIQKLERGEY